jgi:hypothetical protein
MDRAGIRILSALSSMIYNKILKKRVNMKDDETVGEIMNLQARSSLFYFSFFFSRFFFVFVDPLFRRCWRAGTELSLLLFFFLFLFLFLFFFS